MGGVGGRGVRGEKRVWRRDRVRRVCRMFCARISYKASTRGSHCLIAFRVFQCLHVFWAWLELCEGECWVGVYVCPKP